MADPEENQRGTPPDQWQTWRPRMGCWGRLGAWLILLTIFAALVAMVLEPWWP